MKHLILMLILFLTFILEAQTIKGSSKKYIGQELILKGFNYFDTQELDKTVVDSLGFFTFNYPSDYKGIGIIQTYDKSSLILLLTEPYIIFTTQSFYRNDSLYFVEGSNNKQYFKFVKAKAQRDAALLGLKYLESLYKEKAELLIEKSLRKTISKEIKNLESVNVNFLKSLDKESYLRWFINMKQQVTNMYGSFELYKERIPQNIEQFRKINFNNSKFKNSGLFRGLIEGHYKLLENMGQNLDSVTYQMNLSTKYLIENLRENKTLLNKMSSELFNYFEKRSLFKASEYLSLSLLNNSQCSLNDNLVTKLESYRKLKVGAIAPDIKLRDKEKLSDIKTNKLLVFGASWCPTCKTDFLKLEKKYVAWKSKKVEIIYISVDTDKTAFEAAYKKVPWQTYCDYKGWNTQASKDYYISGTPTYFLLDSVNKIVARPYSIKHADNLINQKL